MAIFYRDLCHYTEKIAAAQKAIVRGTEAVSAHILHMPSHMAVVPYTNSVNSGGLNNFAASKTVAEVVKF